MLLLSDVGLCSARRPIPFGLQTPKVRVRFGPLTVQWVLNCEYKLILYHQIVTCLQYLVQTAENRQRRPK